MGIDARLAHGRRRSGLAGWPGVKLVEVFIAQRRLCHAGTYH